MYSTFINNIPTLPIYKNQHPNNTNKQKLHLPSLPTTNQTTPQKTHHHTQQLHNTATPPQTNLHVHTPLQKHRTAHIHQLLQQTNKNQPTPKHKTHTNQHTQKPTTQNLKNTHLPPQHITIIQQQHVTIQILEKHHVTDTTVNHINNELNTLNLKLITHHQHIIDTQRNTINIALELLAESLGLNDGQRQAAGLKLDAKHLTVANGLKQPEHHPVKLNGAINVGGKNVNKVDTNNIHKKLLKQIKSRCA